MHTYIKHRKDYFTVGYYGPEYLDGSGKPSIWHPLQDFKDEQKARNLVNYLNGGSGS